MVLIKLKLSLPCLLAVFVIILAILGFPQKISASYYDLCKKIITKVEQNSVFFDGNQYKCGPNAYLSLNSRPITLLGLSVIVSEYPIEADISLENGYVVKIEAAWAGVEALFTSYVYSEDGTLKIWSESENSYFVCRADASLVKSDSSLHDLAEKELDALKGRYVLFVKGTDGSVRYIYSGD